jgi:hypothetical protein
LVFVVIKRWFSVLLHFPLKKSSCKEDALSYVKRVDLDSTCLQLSDLFEHYVIVLRESVLSMESSSGLIRLLLCFCVQKSSLLEAHKVNAPHVCQFTLGFIECLWSVIYLMGK